MKRGLLIVEDNAEVRNLFKIALEEHAFDIKTFESASSALEYLNKKEWLPDLILCDYVMPGLDGAGFIRQLKATPALAQIRVLLISGADQIASLAKSSGANAYLKKPFDLDDLERAVLNQLEL